MNGEQGAVNNSQQVHVLSCGLVPYPNDDLVRDLRCSVPQMRLCAIRDTLFADPSGNAGFDGRTLGNNNRLSARQVAALRLGLGDPQLDMDTLVACKIILGRWLRPSEMTALFGNAPLVMQRYELTGASGARISHVIGRAGAILNRVTAKSGCLYIWFGKVRNRAVVSMYARTAVALERARKLLNRQGSPMVAEPGSEAPRKVTLRAMYQVISSQHL